MPKRKIKIVQVTQIEIKFSLKNRFIRPLLCSEVTELGSQDACKRETVESAELAGSTLQTQGSMSVKDEGTLPILKDT